MTAARLALLELRRFSGPPLRRLALALVVTVPLLYGALYLWSNWDPYGRLNAVPVAVVNADRPAELDGRTLTAGDEFTAQLKATPMFDWHFVDAAEAREGMDDGRYYFTIVVPEDFSADLVSLQTTAPERASITIRLDDANGYIVGVMAETVQAELQNQINTAAYTAVATTVFGDLADLHSGLADAADGARDLADGTAAADDGAHGLADGLTSLDTGAHRVADGAAQVADGIARIDVVVTDLADIAGDALPGAQDAMSHAADLSAALGADVAAVRDTACAQDPDGRLCGDLTALAERADEIDGTVQGADDAVQALDPAAIDAEAAQVHELADGARDVATGAQALADGLDDAAAGAEDLADGTSRLRDGSAELADGLESAVERLPAADPADNAAAADVLGSPVGVGTVNENPAGVYGRGLAPFFFAIALWVFGLVAFLLLRTVNPRALAGRVGALTTALAGWLPAAVLGTAGAILLYLVVDLGLGLRPEHPAATIGLCVLAVLAFSAIAHFLRLAFGAVGDVLILVLLMLQLTACGGLYPIETAPAFFRALHPYMPMTYFVDAMRVTVSGGIGAHAAVDAAVLAGVLAAAVAASTVTVMRRRRWTMARMKPLIEL